MTKKVFRFDHKDVCRKLEIKPGSHLYITEINSKYQSSFLFSIKVELVLLPVILKRLRISMVSLMLTNNWIYCRKVELLQHVNRKHKNKFCWYAKSSHLTFHWQVFVLYFNPTIFHNLLTILWNNQRGKWKICGIYTISEMPYPE